MLAAAAGAQHVPGPGSPAAGARHAPGSGPPAAGAAPAGTAERSCAAGRILVRGGTADDHDDACAGGEAAIRFLESFGLSPPARVDVQVVERMPQPYDPDAAGCYDPARNLVLLLDRSGFERFGRWLGRPVDRAMHRAIAGHEIAGHEIAHAVSACSFAQPSPSLLAREYVAFVAMFAIMDPAFRRHALEVYPDPPWEDPYEPGEAEYRADPMRFGARAWRHWLASPGRGATLREVLAGRALARPASPWR